MLYNQETNNFLQNSVLSRPVCITRTDFSLFFSVLSTVQHVPDHQGPAGAADPDPAGQHPLAAGGAPEDTGAALPGPGLQRTGALLLGGAEQSILSRVAFDGVGDLKLVPGSRKPGHEETWTCGNLDMWKPAHLNEDVAL